MLSLQIVDDHKLLAESLAKVINESGKASVTRVYHDMESCRRGLRQSLPGILLLDIGLPDGDGVDFCAELKKTYPELKVIMLTTYKEFSIARHALHNGAHGYILKNAEVVEVLAAIETVSSGEIFLCEEIDAILKERSNRNLVWLGTREKEILRYIAEGYTNKEIAEKIFRDVETVRTHRRNLLLKLEAKNTAVMVKKAYEMKLIW
jgi:DNA-binding NarL/FixJ family response regulator